jgi:hypothetical protein
VRCHKQAPSADRVRTNPTGPAAPPAPHSLPLAGAGRDTAAGALFSPIGLAAVQSLTRGDGAGGVGMAVGEGAERVNAAVAETAGEARRVLFSSATRP